MNSLTTLYKRAITGKIQKWTIFIEDNYYWTESGQIDGVITKTEPTYCFSKNIGRANQTTDLEQAFLEAKSKWQKKKDAGCVEDIEKVDQDCGYFKPMLAHKYLDHKDKIQFPVLVSKKIDGLRLSIRKDQMTTRNGKPYYSCDHIKEVLQPLFDAHPNWVLDGELYSSLLCFEQIISITRKKKITEENKKTLRKYLQFWIFDGVVDDEDLGFEARFEIIQSEIKRLVGDVFNIVLVKNEVVHSHEEILAKHEEYVAQGFEGIMIRKPDSPYQNHRSVFLLKYKSFLDDEFEIVNIIEGEGNRAGMAGKIVFLTHEGKEFSAGIKGGEDLYRELLKNAKQYIHKKGTVRFQNYTEDEKPRFPVCVVVDPIDR